MIPTIANIRKAIYCLNKRLDLLEGGEYSSTVTQLSNKVAALESLLDDDALNPTAAIDKFNEIVAFLNSIDNTETLLELLRDIVLLLYQQNYVTVLTYADLPTTGSVGTIYRVSNYNGSTNQIDTTSYSEYVWNNSDYTLLCVKSLIGEVFDISEYHGSLTYLNLEAALDSNNGGGVPLSLQKGGMSVKFVRSSDNNYVQYRLMSDSFNTTIANWQGVDNEPEFESENLINSGSVYDVSKRLDDNLSTADRISLPYVITKGLVPVSGEIVYNAIFDAYIIPLKNGDSVKINVTYSDAYGSGRYGVTADYPVNGASLIFDGGVGYLKDVNNKSYTATQDCYLIVSVEREYVSTGGVNVTIANNGLAKQVETIQAELESQISDLDAQVDGILNSDDTLYKDVAMVVGLIPYSGSIVTNASLDCYYAQVKNGETVTIGLTYTDGYGGGFYGVTKNVPVNGATLLFDGGVNLLKDVKNKSYTATEDCYIVVSVERAYVTGGVSISYPNNGLTKRVERLEQEVDKVVIGVGGDFTTVKDGLEFAHRHNIDTVIILPGEYNLVAEGIEDYSFYKYNNPNLKEGFYATKKIYGYGAILRCELSEPNSEISPLNHYYGNDQMEVYGLTIIVANCRYCIHDEMWNMAAYGCNYYHDVFKDLTLIHKTAPNETWSAPINIGGGFGEKGDITIENCVMESEDTKNLDYHTKPASTGAQNGNCNVMVKDCVMNKKVTITNSGSVDTFMNTMYVTNCYSGLAINNSSGANTRLIGWNNVVQQ